MKTTRFTELQIVAVLKQSDATTFKCCNPNEIVGNPDECATIVAAELAKTTAW